MAVSTTAATPFAIRMRAAERRNFVLVVLDGALFAFAISLVSETTIIPAFVQALTGDAALVGLVGAAYALGHYLPQLIGAHLVLGRSRRKPTLVRVVVAERGGMLAMALVAMTVDRWPTEVVVPLFFLAFAGYAATTGLIGPVYGDFLAKALPRSRGWYYGLSQLFGGLLGLGAALVAQRLLATYAFPIGNQLCLWLAFVLSFASIPLVASLHDEPIPRPEPRGPLRATLRRIPEVIGADRTYRSFLAVRAVLAAATAAMGLVVVHGLTAGFLRPADAGVVAGAFVLAQAAGGFGLSLLGTYAGWRTVVVAGGVLLLVGMGGALLATDVVGVVGVYAALGAANAATIIGDPNMSIELAPEARTSLYIGTTSTALAPFFVLAPLLGGALARSFGYPLVFVLAGVLAAVGTALALTLREPRRRRDVGPYAVGQPGTVP